MRSGNALLVELLIVVMFFMLTTTVLLEVFTKADSFSTRSELLTVSMVEAQNVADRLYAAEDPEALLKSLGYESKNGIWTLEKETYQMEAVISPEVDESGTFRRQLVRVVSGGKEIYSLPCSRWEVNP